MTNIKKYGKMLNRNFGVNKITKMVMDCGGEGEPKCNICKFSWGYEYSCDCDRYQWLFQEYEKPLKVEFTDAERDFVKTVKNGKIDKYGDELIYKNTSGDKCDLKQFNLKFESLKEDGTYKMELLLDVIVSQEEQN